MLESLLICNTEEDNLLICARKLYNLYKLNLISRKILRLAIKKSIVTFQQFTLI